MLSKYNLFSFFIYINKQGDNSNRPSIVDININCVLEMRQVIKYLPPTGNKPSQILLLDVFQVNRAIGHVRR